MGCCAGCPDRKRPPFAPCSDCGPYGTICCLKMTAGDGTWYLRSYPNVGGDIPENYWQPGDDCDSGTDGYAHDSINLCGQLRSSGPCGNNPPRQWVGWQVLDDCSGNVLRLHYDTGHGIAKFSVTVDTSWISTGLPITFTTPDSWTGEGEYDGGDVTLQACQEGEPPPPIYKICCMQLSAVGRWGTNVKKDRSQAATDLCIDDDSELRISHAGTEQCQSGVYYLLDDASGEDVIASGAHADPFSRSLGSYSYTISDDYSTITLSVDYNFNHYSTGFPMTWQEVYLGTYTVDIPFTADWFLTPIEFEIEGVDISNDDEPVFATLTLSVCGYDVGGDPCWGDKLVCVDLAYETSSSLDGTFAMPWDGEQYVSEWQTYSAFFEVRIRLRESETTPGTWETILDVKDLTVNDVDSTVIGSEEIECDPDGIVSGGGTGVVTVEDLTVTIHECDEQCLQQTEQMYVTIEPRFDQQYTPGTYAMSSDGVRYLTSWSPVIAGGGGYQIRFILEVDTDPEAIGLCEDIGPGIVAHILRSELYDVDTEETTSFILLQLCFVCGPNDFGVDPLTYEWPVGEGAGLPPEATLFS